MSGARFVVTGTDTGIGKTVFAAALAGALGATYWKPVQAGLDEDGISDSDRVVRLSGARALPEAYRLETPCSPHLAAEIDGVEIDPLNLTLPDVDGPLVIEGAGGALVPLTRSLLYADVFAEWGLPVVLVASTRLGTINHSLLSLEALRARGVVVHGVAFVGEANTESERIIADLGQVRRLGRLPFLPGLDRAALADAFTASFDLQDFAR